MSATDASPSTADASTEPSSTPTTSAPPGGAAAGGPRVDPRIERTRAAVLGAATELLVSEGVAALTIEAVVQRSGVARSTIYRHWPTRTDLVADTVAGLVRPLPTPPAGATLRERLRALLAPLASVPGASHRMGLIPSLLAEADHNPELAGFRQRFTDAYTAPMAAVLADAVEAGELPADTDLDAATSQLLGPLMFHRFVFADGALAPDFAEEMIDRFVASRRA